jgi:hypothetical protein
VRYQPCLTTCAVAGLDSASTFTIVQSLRNLARATDATVVVALLQPEPQARAAALCAPVAILFTCSDRVAGERQGTSQNPWHTQCTRRSQEKDGKFSRCLQVYDLFDDVLLLANGRILYQGPRVNVTGHFKTLGFECTGHKAEADFLQARRCARLLHCW